MKRVKKIFIITIILLSTLFIYNRVSYVKADSGWDSSYDSGGSWDSGSDWSSSSDYSYSSSDGELNPEFIFIVIVFIIIFIVYTNIESKRNSNQNSNNSSVYKNNYKNNYNDIDESKIKEIDNNLNIDNLKKQAFEIYKNIQTAWMDQNYQELEKYTSDELFNTYKSQLKVLESKGQKNIMKDIVYKDAKILDINIVNNIINVKLYLNVETYDYVVDNNNKTVRGDDSHKLNIKYEITLIKNNKSIDRCPNCNGNIKDITSGICPYCDSHIVNNNNNFVMSKKECIGQTKK